MKIKVLMIIIGLIILPMNCLAADPWPGSAGATITNLPEASGIVWHPERETLFVVENSGTLVEINTDGQTIDSWAITGDLEGIALAQSSQYLYLGIENPDSIVEFDLGTESLTGKSWDLTPWMSGPENSGLEGLAYSNGYFYAGLQADGQVYVFDVNLAANGNVSHIETFTPDNAYASDISGMDINSITGRKYIVYDTYNALVELDSGNIEVKDYVLPGNSQEGIAVVPNCSSNLAEIYIADDSGQVVKYSNYPITCLDTTPPSAPTGLGVM